MKIFERRSFAAFSLLVSFSSTVINCSRIFRISGDRNLSGMAFNLSAYTLPASRSDRMSATFTMCLQSFSGSNHRWTSRANWVASAIASMFFSSWTVRAFVFSASSSRSSRVKFPAICFILAFNSPTASGVAPFGLTPDNHSLKF